MHAGQSGETIAIGGNGTAKTCRCIRVARFLIGLWAFLMLTVFPLYMKNHYSKMGVRKFQFFLAVSVGCLIPAGICLGLPFLRERAWKGNMAITGRLSSLDWAVCLYMAAACISWCLSVDREAAWSGVEGWSMGLRTQLIFGLIYFLASRQFPWKKVIFAGHFISSGAVFGLGILHRFGIDPLGMYEGIDESWQLLFLSTIGQATWYSSYVCTVLVLGVVGFFVSQKPVCRLAMGLYCMLGFSAIAVQNSDSAFVATAFLMFGLFLAACDSLEWMERFWETMILVMGSFKIIGVMQKVFADRAVKLGGLSEFLSQSMQTWVIFLLVCAGYLFFLLYRQRYPDHERPAYGKRLRKAAVVSVPAALFFYVAAVWLNTTGRLEAWLGIRSANSYLLFDRYWGNSRGFTWSFTVNAYAGFPVFRKLFGAGPDCFSAYCYADPKLCGELNHFFGWDQTLTNAHNEFLNTLFCMGIAGLITFSLIFVTAFCRFWKGRKEEMLLLMGMLVVLIYAAHNFFCYQQVCCTPFLFLILGMSENRLRQKKAYLNGQKIAAVF